MCIRDSLDTEPTPAPEDPGQQPSAFPWKPLLLAIFAVLILAALVVGPPLYRAQQEKRACRTLSLSLIHISSSRSSTGPPSC